MNIGNRLTYTSSIAQELFVRIMVHAHVRKYWEAYGECHGYLVIGIVGEEPQVARELHLWGEGINLKKRSPSTTTLFNAKRSAHASYARLNRNISKGHVTSLQSGKPGGAILHPLFGKDCIISIGGIPDIAKETFALILAERADPESGIPEHIPHDQMDHYRSYYERLRHRRREIVALSGNEVWIEILKERHTWWR
jgi:hypothetical protein